MEIFNAICYVLLYIIGFCWTYYKLSQQSINKIEINSFGDFAAITALFLFWYFVIFLMIAVAVWTVFVKDWDDIAKL
jgi:hypothetical protein